MEKIKDLFCLIKVIFTIRIYPISKDFDDWMKKKMDEGEKPKFINKYDHSVVIFGGKEIWIKNKFFASPRLGNICIYPVLPKAATTCRFFKLVDELYMNELKKMN